MFGISIARVPSSTRFGPLHTAPPPATDRKRSNGLKCRRSSVKIKVSFVATITPIWSSSVVLAPLARSSLSATSHSQDSSSDETSGDNNREQFEKHPETVVISTTKNSGTARAISNEPEDISEKYVRGPLTFKVEVSPSFGLENETASEIEVDEGQEYEALDQHPSEIGGAVFTPRGDEGTLWGSEPYLRKTLKARYLTETVKTRQRYKEVILRYPTTNLPVGQLPFKNENIIQDIDGVTDRSELQSGAAAASDEEEPMVEEELHLRRALNAKRQLAGEILEASLRAGDLGFTFTESLLSFMPQFIDRIVTEAVALKKYAKYKEMSFNSRARLYITNVKVVELIKWLKHQKLTAPRIGKLLSTVDESLGLIKSRIQWLRNIYVRGRDLGVIIERYPQILGFSLKDLNKNVEILENAGVQRKWMGLVVSRQPRVLTLGGDDLLEKISMFTELGLSKEQFGIMVFKFPAIVGHFSVEEMQSKVDYLREIGIDDWVLVKILASTPQLLACSIEVSWDKLLRYFYSLKIDLSGIRRILGVNPSVFCLNLEENIAPKVKFLCAIGVHEDAIGQLIVDFPAMLTYSLEKKIRPVAGFGWQVRFLLEEAGVREGMLGKVLTMQPELIRCSLPNKLLVLVKYLRSKGFRAGQIGGMIEDFPALLMYSVPALHPKFLYLTRVMKRSLADAGSFPRYFSYSLQSRIIPRHELLNEKGLNFGLRQMLACSDEVYNSRVAVAAEKTDPMTTQALEEPPHVVQDQHSTLFNEVIATDS